MAKSKTAFVCAECGADHNKWQGQCAGCGAWNTLSEIVIEGIKTNVPLHEEIFNHSAFRAGGTDIHYLERRLGL